MSKKVDLYYHIKDSIINNIDTIQHVGFWNDSLNFDESPKPAVYVEFLEMPITDTYQKVSGADRYSETRQEVNFNLHLVCNKNNTDDKDLNYIEQIEIADLVVHELQETTFKDCRHIVRQSERYDNNSQVTMDWIITFKAVINNCGYTDFIKKMIVIENNIEIV